MSNKDMGLIDMIREVRRLTGAGLKEAKDAVEEMGSVKSAVAKLKPVLPFMVRTHRPMTLARWGNLFANTALPVDCEKYAKELIQSVLLSIADEIEGTGLANSRSIAERVRSIPEYQ